MTSTQVPRRLVVALRQGIAIGRSHHQSCFSQLGRPFSSLTFSSLTSLIHTPLSAPLSTIRAPSRQSYGTAAAAATDDGDRKKIVFLGTPEVAALVLDKLLAASKHPGAAFDIAAVVSQPGRPKGRSRQPQPSPVEKLALESGFSTAQILCPDRATDSSFLDTLATLQPDLCITAAYGNYLPTRFLATPRFGTLNIHPSLLPLYRGAAPVQRSLQDGVTISGVTVLYTVREMDAGPILVQQQISVDSTIQAPQLLPQLFELGADLLMQNLEAVWAGKGQEIARAQNGDEATHAAKITREEGALNFEEAAATCHNKVRGFAGWPGTYHTFEMVDAQGSRGVGKEDELELKILKTRIVSSSSYNDGGDDFSREVVAGPESLRIACGDGSVLEVLEVQAPGRKAVAAKDFINGLKGRSLRWKKVC